MSRTVAAIAALVPLLLASACQNGEGEDPVANGKRVYTANCLACHNADPARDGTLGPAIAGSSRELIEARVVRGEFPPGYTPKRESGLMQPMPYLANDVDALAAYLNSL